MNIIQYLKTQLGLDRYASERDLLQMELWAIHPHRKRLDRIHRKEIELDVYLNWPRTEAEIHEISGKVETHNAARPQGNTRG